MEMTTLLPPAQPGSLAPTRRAKLRWALSRLRAYTSVQEPPADQREQAIYGFAQPILGARVLLSDRQLLVEALQPAALLALGCAFYATFSADAYGSWGW